MSTTDPIALWNDIKAGKLRAVAKQLYPEAKCEPEHGPCDICEERPGDRVVKVSGLCVCIECDEKEDAPNRRFHTNDDAAAYDAGVRARGEI